MNLKTKVEHIETRSKRVEWQLWGCQGLDVCNEEDKGAQTFSYKMNKVWVDKYKMLTIVIALDWII